MFGLIKKQDAREVEITITNRTIMRVLFSVLVWIIFLAALHKATHALVLIFTAFFLALALDSPVHWIAQRLPGKRRGNRTVATAVSFLLVVAFLGTFLASVVPPIVRQTNTFIQSAPGLVANVRSQDSDLGKFVRKYHLEGQVDTFSRQLSDRLKNASGAAVSTAAGIGSSIFATLTILALTFMMLIEGPYWLGIALRLMPNNHAKQARLLGLDMYKVIRGYVNGQVLLAALAATLLAPMLFMLHISYPIALVLLVFICGLIPMVGHTMGAIIVSLVALFHSPLTALIILAYYILYQQIENYVIQPRVQANSTNLSPLLVFIAVVIGVNFGGLLGGLVAIPIMGCLKVLVVDQLHRRHMLESVESVGPVRAETK
jgi:predicted PurR-regulated permease PerM